MTSRQIDIERARLKAADVCDAFPELDEITDTALRDTIVRIWIEIFEESPWRSLHDIPKNPYAVPAEATLVNHTRAVTRMAMSVAQIAHELHDIPYDNDLLIAAANLHDVSKIREFEPSESGSQASRYGLLIQHGFYGAYKATEKNLPTELVHAIIVHTNSSTYTPQTWESAIVHYVDYLDSDAINFKCGLALHAKK